jgi:hypothetical protein
MSQIDDVQKSTAFPHIMPPAIAVYVETSDQYSRALWLGAKGQRSIEAVNDSHRLREQACRS